MLKKFLWFFPLRYGAFTVASTAVVVSAVSMVKDFECLSTAAVSQGNLAFRMFYFISSILLLVATKDKNYRIMGPWLILQAIGQVDSLFNFFTQQTNFLEVLVLVLVLETYCWIVVFSLYKKLKRYQVMGQQIPVN